jgi:hypothetical protein
MLSSLFGELRSLRSARAQSAASTSKRSAKQQQQFAVTAIMDHSATTAQAKAKVKPEPDPQQAKAPLKLEQQVHDLVVSGSPAQAIRDHFGTTRANLGTANRQITLLDPSGIWAPAVIKALSDATGRAVERLHLREQGTLRTLAMIERTLLERHNEEPLRVYHAQVRAPGRDNAAIPDALMERSHLTAVIVGAMSPQAVDDMLCALYMAVQKPNWRCPTLLFMLPPNAVWISNKIALIDWPRQVRVQSVNESLGSASAVWNSLLSMWNRAKLIPTLSPAPTVSNAQESLLEFPIVLNKIAPPNHFNARANLSKKHDSTQPTLSVELANQALQNMSHLEGLLGCAVVDAETGLILTRQAADKHPFHLDLAAARAAQLLRIQRQVTKDMGVPDDVQEITTTAGNRHHLIRLIEQHTSLFLFALLDKNQSNLALARYKLMEAEQGLLAHQMTQHDDNKLEKFNTEQSLSFQVLASAT